MSPDRPPIFPQLAVPSKPFSERGPHWRPSGHDSLTLADRRQPFAHDVDRILHAGCFRRLQHKTQVFVQADDDHFRTRLTHTLEVTQIGRALSIELGLNQTLTEAICLSHDLGHPPFGHGGEQALQDLCKTIEADAEFEHNHFGLQLVTELEPVYLSAHRKGLDLTRAVISGLIAHQPSDSRVLQWVRDRYQLESLGGYGSLESQIAHISDDIAYCCHDLEDALFDCLRRDAKREESLEISLTELIEQFPLIKQATDDLQRQEGIKPVMRPDYLIELRRSLLNLLIIAVFSESRRRIQASRLQNWQQVESYPHALIGFQDKEKHQVQALKAFMTERVYHHRLVLEPVRAGQSTLKKLYAKLEADHSQRCDYDNQAKNCDTIFSAEHAMICYIAALTDKSAQRKSQ